MEVLERLPFTAQKKIFDHLAKLAYYSACKGIRVDLTLDAVQYKELMDNLIEDEKNRAEYLAADWNSGS